MDVRAVVFDLIAGDVVLAAVRVVHTDQGQNGQAAARSGCERCSIVLEWAENDQVHAPAGSHSAISQPNRRSRAIARAVR